MKYLIIGDVIEDVFIKGSILGISAETPTMVMKKESTESISGGAGLVQAHIQKLCERGDWVTQQDHNPIITKTRFFVDDYKLFQTDEFHPAFPVHLEDVLRKIRLVDIVVVADNRHGRLDLRAAEFIVGKCRGAGKPLFVDSQMSQNKSNHHWYEGATTMLLNEKEATAIGSIGGYLEIGKSGLQRLKQKYDWENIIIKLGKDGSVALIGDKYFRTPGVEVEAIDTCGAGDAFMAALVSRGEINEESLEFANEYAASTCTYIGTGVKYD